MGEAAARVAALQEAQREINKLSAESAAPPSEQEQVRAPHCLKVGICSIISHVLRHAAISCAAGTAGL